MLNHSSIFTLHWTDLNSPTWSKWARITISRSLSQLPLNLYGFISILTKSTLKKGHSVKVNVWLFKTPSTQIQLEIRLVAIATWKTPKSITSHVQRACLKWKPQYLPSPLAGKAHMTLRRGAHLTCLLAQSQLIRLAKTLARRFVIFLILLEELWVILFPWIRQTLHVHKLLYVMADIMTRKSSSLALWLLIWILTI